MAHTEDQWVRLFNVSDPRRAYAGYTLYKVTSKVFQKDFPEGITEITVWRRFKDFKKLHQDLLKIYNQKHSETNFPSFPKAKFFGRFDEAVIEERQKGALELLTFAGNIPDLFTSLPFVKFFEGGFPESPTCTKDNRSESCSLSDTEEKNTAMNSTPQDFENENKNDKEDSKEFTPSALNKETGDYPEESLGGVWLCKQPSLSEGLDNASSDEEDSDDKVIPNSLCVSNCVNASEQIGFQNTEEEEEDEVFNESGDDSSNICDIERNSSATEPPNWLVRAISICSEGEDLEVLASGADTNELDATLNFPLAFSDYTGLDEKGSNQCSGRLHSYEGSVHVQVDQDISDDCCSPQQNVDSSLPCEKPQHTEIDCGNTVNLTDCANELSPRINNSCTKDSDSCKDSAAIGTAEESQSFTSSSNSGKIVMRQRTISDLGNISIDVIEGDYLYNAGRTIRKALDCEVNGMYEEAFSLYRTCVGLLLCGVQGEKDVQKREAVRRKTAQYLLKAEALYNTYLVENDSVENKQQVDASHSSSAVDSENDDLKNFRNLTLAELKVIGVVGKVILVENLYSGETFVVKALHKSGPSRKHSSSHGSDGHQRRSHTCLYGKYPNIVRLYRFFETSTAVYLLLEYARGGKLWDHLQCYQRHRDSQDYLLGRINNLDVNNVQQNSCKDVVGSNDGSADGRSKDNASFRLETFENSSKQEGSSWSDSNGTKTNDVPSSEHNLDEQEMKMSAAQPCSKCSLFTKLDEYFSSSVERLPEENIRIWAAELVLAVGYLHTAGVLCRDLHPGNILLDDEGHVLLSYFGLWEETAHVPDEFAIDHLYCAPEVSHVEEVTPAADWWSVGALLYEIITSKRLSSAHPWGIKTHTELQLPVRISPEAKSLLKELLRVAPSERLGSGVNGIEDIKSHPFFSGINWTWLCSRIS